MHKAQIGCFSLTRPEGSDIMVESGQAKELGQMQERVEQLDALLICVAQRLNGSNNMHGLSDNELSDYDKLIQERVDAVLIYAKVAEHWTTLHKQWAKALIDKALAAHIYLTNIFEEQSRLLAKKIKNIDVVLKKKSRERQTSYGDNSGNSGCMFNLEG